MIGIIGAMDAEIKTLISKMENPKTLQISGLTFNSGILEGKEVVVVKSGIGKVNAAVCTTILIREFKPECVINTGIAGAMADGLRMFDFVVSTDAVNHDVDVQIFGYKAGQVPGLPLEFPADEKLISAVQTAFSNSETLKYRKLVKGVVASGDQFISSKEKKNFIKQTFDAACTEMEGAAIAQACHLSQIPFVIVRCMSDMADDTAETTYVYNEDTAAAECSDLVLNVLNII